jgi:hypothetical protein
MIGGPCPVVWFSSMQFCLRQWDGKNWSGGIDEHSGGHVSGQTRWRSAPGMAETPPPSLIPPNSREGCEQLNASPFFFDFEFFCFHSSTYCFHVWQFTKSLPSIFMSISHSHLTEHHQCFFLFLHHPAMSTFPMLRSILLAPIAHLFYSNQNHSHTNYES